MKSKEYFLGLDLGTNSVGWAVTDERYKLQRFNKKDMWGSRLFEEAKTANDRRVHRSNRRRLDRHKKRIGLLQELFAEEIFKVDPTFFMRLKESKFHLEDKDGINSKFTLFDDENFTDKEYYEKYPTIYHLRKDLMESEEKKDIRLIYLAIHHIIKNRGHFLFERQKFDIKGVFDKVFLNLSNYLCDNFNFELPYEKKEEIKNIISDKKLKLKDKSDSLINICNAEEEQFKAILSVMIGGSRKLSKIYNNDELNEAEKNDVDFKKSTFTDEYELYKQILKEDILLLDKLKAIYDWVVLSNILGSHKYISHSKVFDYERHKEDLKDLKYIIKKYGKEGDMNNF